MAKYEIAVGAPTYPEHRSLWSCSGWPIVTEEQFESLCAGTDHFLSARTENALIGMARLVTDGALYGYIQDVIVHPACRRQGIGAALLSGLLSRAEELKLRFVGLFSTLEARAFYEHHGFTTLSEINVGLGLYTPASYFFGKKFQI
jgi:ribosomal protein S18 acetylase RimI-like enzyme